jgi:predicted DNA-binding transcriptional regulator AlpA
VIQLLTIDEVSCQLQVPVDTLYYWRSTGYGPQALKVGKYLRWRQEALDAWIDSLSPVPAPEPTNVTPIKIPRTA